MTDSAKIRELRARIKELEAKVASYKPAGPEFKNFRLEESGDDTILRYNEEGEVDCDWSILKITKEGEISRYTDICGSKVFKTDNGGSVVVND